jgi:hypothetical protein
MTPLFRLSGISSQYIYIYIYTNSFVLPTYAHVKCLYLTNSTKHEFLLYERTEKSNFLKSSDWSDRFCSWTIINSNTVLRFRGVTTDGVWIGEWIYWPLTQLATTSATANLHNSQITAVPANPFPACCFLTSRCFVTALNNGDSSTSVPTQLPAGYYYSQLISLLQLSWL